MGAEHRLLFDVTGLVAWYSFFRTPTGIQRVLERVLAEPAIADDPSVVRVARVPGASSLFVLDRKIFQGLGKEGAHDAAILRIRQAYREMLASVPLVPSVSEMEWFQAHYFAWTWLGIRHVWDPHRAALADPAYVPPIPIEGIGARDVFVNMGDFWWFPGQGQAIDRLKARHGFTVVQMIHDLFPLGTTAWEPRAFGKKFVKQFGLLVPLVDRWLTNSKFVASELRRHLQQAGARCDRIDTVPMGWEIPPPVDASSVERDRSVLRRHGLEERKYFLQVGTFEPRKNHIAVVRAVERLRQRYGGSLPTCVFAGAKGWRSGALIRHLEHTRFADGAIRWLRGIRDGELGALYRGALFTVYPSLMEGWGLPVQESLSHGVPCIASHAGAIPEAGSDLAVYVDPADDMQLTAAIERYVSDPSALVEARSRIAAFLADGTRLPSWRDAAKTVLEAAGHAREGG